MNTGMKTVLLLTLALGVTADAAAQVQSALPRGNSLQSWQDPGLSAVLAKCKAPAKPFSIGGPPPAAGAMPPPAPPEPVSTAIPGVIAAGQKWRVVWAGEGNNLDGIIPTDDGAILAARNDASDVIRIDANGRETVVHRDTKTGGSLARSKNGNLFVVARGLNPSIVQLEPEKKVLANTFNGEPLDCLGGILNDLVADSKGGVYFTMGAVFHANPQGLITRYGEDLQTNGIVLSPDEKTLYVTHARTLVAFDVQADGSLTNQRVFAQLAGPRGDGSAVDSEGRLYVSTGTNVDVIGTDGKLLGTIPGPPGVHGVAFGGPDKRTLYAVTLTGFMSPAARSQLIAIPVLARGYPGRAK